MKWSNGISTTTLLLAKTFKNIYRNSSRKWNSPKKKGKKYSKKQAKK